MRQLWKLSLLGVLFLASPPRAAADGRSVEYLYIESNEGGSSGSHVALHLGDEVFHIEHRAPGVLILGRDGFEHFRFRYGVLENRTTHVSRIPVSEDTSALLVDRFRRRPFVQTRHLDVMESLRGDRATLEQMLSGDLVVSGAGYFVPDRESSLGRPLPARAGGLPRSAPVSRRRTAPISSTAGWRC